VTKLGCTNSRYMHAFSYRTSGYVSPSLKEGMIHLVGIPQRKGSSVSACQQVLCLSNQRSSEDHFTARHRVGLGFPTLWPEP
jgi:hypothetical protein